jgi:hypothetical protein
MPEQATRTGWRWTYTCFVVKFCPNYSFSKLSHVDELGHNVRKNIQAYCEGNLIRFSRQGSIQSHINVQRV